MTDQNKPTNPESTEPQEVELTIEALDQAAGGAETYVNRVKTSDKHQKAVLDFVKG